ncbi:hypothetical protein BJY04DRAFT_193629 [Aspergillus karnatakaensis]|uniref:HMG-box domain-containing protein n=1 Tax=Aspergillus karnatakaensis TaxID=1810916 RepID=UPI003CCDD50C
MPVSLTQSGGGILRILPVNGALVRSVRVISSQQHARRFSYFAHRPLPTLATPGFLPSSIVGNIVRRYATRGRPRKDASKPRRQKTAPKKKPLTDEQQAQLDEKLQKQKERKKELAKKAKAIADRKALRLAMLTPPKALPVSWWAIAVHDKLPDAQKSAESAKDVKGIFKIATDIAKAMSAEEKQRYVDQGAANKAANKAALDAWVKSHTPLQIAKANHARSKVALLTDKRMVRIPDDRAVKGPKNAFLFYYEEAHDTSDLQGLPTVEKVRRAGTQWKKLPKSEKEKYLKLAEDDMERYAREHMEVYGFPAKNIGLQKKKMEERLKKEAEEASTV